MASNDPPAASGREHLRECAARAVAALWPYRHEYESVRRVLLDIFFEIGQVPSAGGRDEG